MESSVGLPPPRCMEAGTRTTALHTPRPIQVGTDLIRAVAVLFVADLDPGRHTQLLPGT